MRDVPGVLAVAAAIAVVSSTAGCEWSDWEIERLTPDHVPGNAALGVDLVTPFVVRLHTKEPNQIVLPKELRVVTDDDTVEIEDVGPPPDCSAGCYHEIHIIPRTPGKKRVRLIADNTTQVGEYQFYAAPYVALSFHMDGPLHSIDRSELQVSEVTAFAGSKIVVFPSFRAESGGFVTGYAGVSVDQPQGWQSSIERLGSGYQLTLDPRPHQLRILSDVIATSLPVDAADFSVVASLGWRGRIVPKTHNEVVAYKVLDPKEPTIYSSEAFSADVFAMDGGGRFIAGEPPPQPFTASVEGDAAALASAAGERPARIEGRQPGRAVLHFSWGGRTLDVPLLVKRPGQR
jgi:hypothetical protein